MVKKIPEDDIDYLSISEARRRLPSLPEMLREKPEALGITRREKPVRAVMPWDLYESIIETLDVMGDPELMAALREGIRDVEAGRVSTTEELRRELGL